MEGLARIGGVGTPSLFREASQVEERFSEVALLIQGQVRRLREGVWMKVGSDRGSHIRVDETHVSSKHALVRRSGSHVEILDSRSTNGVWWQGKRHEELRLELNQVFFLGSVPALIVEAGVSRRYPKAYRWCGMTLMPRSSLLLQNIVQMAVHQEPVMILGESGTGKERVARALHAVSGRADQPFVALNCAAMPDNLAEGELFGVQRGAFTGADRSRMGLFERATGGTLFLDEVGELSPMVQSKLLRVLETQLIHPLGGGLPRKVDVRIIAATWRDLRESKLFRHDLYQRLNVLPLQLRPLRCRPDEIGPLLEVFLAERRALHQWPSETIMDQLISGSWHGNIRELRNRVIRTACSGNVSDLIPDDVPGLHLPAPRRGALRTHLTEDRIRRSLAFHQGNRSAAAKELGISRSTLYRRLQRSG